MANKQNVEEINFKELLRNKKVPILVLDGRWYELFPDYDKPEHIKKLEEQLNNLLKEQGKAVNDIKDMKKLKTKLMKEIVENMDVSSSETGKIKAKKLEKSQQFIVEINDRLKEADGQLMDLPYKIKSANEELLIECMKICYLRLGENRKKIEQLEQWILKVREALKNRILIKQDLEANNTMTYSYMHDIFGAEIMEMFDKQQMEKETAKE